MEGIDEDLTLIYGEEISKLVDIKPKLEDIGVRTPDGRGNVPKGSRRTGGASGTPKSFFSSPAVYTPVVLSESENYGNRSGKGDAIFRYNCTDSSSWPSTNDEHIWNVELYTSDDSRNGCLNGNVKYMFQKTRDVSAAMNQSIHELAMDIVNENELEGYQNLKESTTEVAVYVGRICGEGNGKLTASSVYFEGTRESSNGHIVSLDINTLDECFLFPGQVVALGGSNNLGKCVIVKNIFVPKALPFPEKPLAINGDTGPLSILVAAGPFTPADSLSFEAFDDLLEKIREAKPRLCILLGPFLDESHPKLEEFLEKQENTFETFFRNKVNQLCDLELKGTQFVLVASSKDVHHHPVYPTPPYNINNDDHHIIKINKEIVTTVPDPAIISVGGVVIGLTSTDILMHMQKNVLAHATIHTDRFGRTAREILSQRNFYPLYPPHETVPLDVGLWTEYCHMDVTPHILVLPSELNHFIKDVDKTVVLNPGRLSTGKRTYARLQVEVPDPAAHPTASIADNVMGEILKI